MNVQQSQSQLEKNKTELVRSQVRLNQVQADNQKNEYGKTNISGYRSTFFGTDI